VHKLLVVAAAALTLTAMASAQTIQNRPVVNAPPIIDAPSLIGAAPSLGGVRDAADRLLMRPSVSPQRLAQARADEPWDPWVAMHPLFGDSFTAARLPRTARVFGDVVNALSPVIGAAKNQTMRRRPFFADPSVVQCDQLESAIANQSSFPSGHSSGGWAWALVMAELVPWRADAILQRGRDFGDSRVICGYHFESDVEAGRLLAAGVIARMHADAGFRRDLDAARAELARAYPMTR
jgi:acid phosphatase (class A)